MPVLGVATALSRGPSDAPALLIFQLNDIVSFSLAFGLAVWWRRRPEFHRRLMLIASCGLTDAAFGRFPLLPLAFSPGGLDALILLGILRDLIVDRRIHKVYLYAFPLLIVIQIFCMQTYLHTAHWWLRI